MSGASLAMTRSPRIPALGAPGGVRPAAELPGGEAEPPSDLASLAAEPWRCSFHQAVRRLLRAAPQRPGAAGSCDGALRLRARISQAFPPSEVAEVRLHPREDAGPWAEVEVAILSMAGRAGPLPGPWYEEILAGRRTGEPALAELLDLLFHHRQLWLLYRAWERARFYVPWERGERDPLSVALLARLGRLSDGGGGPPPPSALALLPFAGRLGSGPASAETAAAVLRASLGPGLRFEILPLRGRWIEIDAESRARLGAGPRLGGGCILGERAWDAAGAVELRFLDVPWGAHERLLPSAPEGDDLDSLLLALFGPSVTVYRTVRLREGAARGLRLSAASPGGALGRDALLGPPLAGARLSLAGRPGGPCVPPPDPAPSRPLERRMHP